MSRFESERGKCRDFDPGRHSSDLPTLSRPSAISSSHPGPATPLSPPPAAPQGDRGMEIRGGPCRLKIAQTGKLRWVQVNLTSLVNVHDRTGLNVPPTLGRTALGR